MKLLSRSFVFYLTLTAVILAFLTDEVEGRRKILRGRRTVTRSYMRSLGIPAWALILIIGICQLIVGGVIYIVMKKVIIDPPITGSYSVAPQHEV